MSSGYYESRSQTARLGCGTLIFIAVIAIYFGNTTNTLKNEVSALRAEVERLQDQHRQTHALVETIVLHLDALPRPAPPAPPAETTGP